MKKTFTIFFCMMIFPLSAMSQTQDKKEYAGATLLSGVQGVGNLSTIPMGLDIRLEDDWYTYWRMAGDNGLPPKFDWSDSTNVKDVAISWPIPSRFTLMDMHSFGYKNAALLPLSITPSEIGKPVTLDLKINLVVCHEICVPQDLHVEKKIDAGNSLSSPDATIIKNAEKFLPSKENTQYLALDAAVLGKDAIVLTATSQDGFKDGADIIVETPSPLLVSPPEIILDAADKTRAVMKVKAPSGMDLTKELFGKKATILLIHNGKAVEKEFSF